MISMMITLVKISMIMIFEMISNTVILLMVIIILIAFAANVTVGLEGLGDNLMIIVMHMMITIHLDNDGVIMMIMMMIIIYDIFAANVTVVLEG